MHERSKKRETMKKRNKMTELFKIERIAQGHEMWIEHKYKHGHTGEKVDCKLCFGNAMKIDGILDIEKVRAFVFDPQNKKSAMSVDKKEDYLIASFIVKTLGYHTVVAEYDIGVLDLPHPGFEGPRYYCQYAKTTISVGHESKEYNLIAGHELEIVPLNLRQYRVGDKVVLRVLYDQEPLPDAIVNAIVRGGDTIERKTDVGGKATIELEKEGDWMFLVRHRDPQKIVKGEYNEKIITSTLTLMNIEMEE